MYTSNEGTLYAINVAKSQSCISNTYLKYLIVHALFKTKSANHVFSTNQGKTRKSLR